MADLFSIEDAKCWIGIDPTDDTRDELLESLVRAASQSCLKIIGRDPLKRRYTETVNGWGGNSLALNNYPISSVASVTINSRFGGAPLPPATYTWDEYAIYYLDGIFPLGKRNIDLVYVAGEDPRPEPITLAGKYTVKAMWDAKLIDMNSTGESWEQVGGSTFWPSGPGAVPPQARSLLEPYVSRIRA